MRTATLLWLAPTALASAIPSFEEASLAVSFDKRQIFSPNLLGAKILQTDVYAGIAAINQQIFQATQKPAQFKKCNPTNIVVRKEWLVCSSPCTDC
jgi:tyrosinase